MIGAERLNGVRADLTSPGEFEPAQPLSAAELSSTARLRIGRRVVASYVVSSTNDVAFAALARDGELASGTAFVAETQTAGRGRRGRAWYARPGRGVLLSVALRVPSPPPPAAMVASAAVAVRDAIRSTAELEATIKWPNDLLIGGKKVCGILVEARATEARADFAMGIGVNVNDDPEHDFDPSVRGTATSLAAASGRTIDRAAFARALLDHLDRRLSAMLEGDRRDIEAEFVAGLGLEGRRVRLEVPGGERTGVLRAFDGARGVRLELAGGDAWIAAETIARVAPEP